jgi:hypothetical protein
MRIVVMVALLASVVVNVVLLAGRARTNASSSAPVGAAVVPAESAPSVPARALAATPTTCAHALFEAERQLVDVRARLEKALPLPERFAESESEPAPAAEAALLPEITRIFAAPELANASFTLECHGTTCQLEILSKGEQVSTWMRVLQADAGLRRRVSQTTFRSGRPTNDQTTGAPLQASTVFFGLAQGGEGSDEPGRALDGLWQDFIASSVPAECAARLTAAERAASVDARGLDVRLDVNVDGPGVHAFVGGALGATAAGRCIAERLASAAATRTIAPEAPSAVRYLTFTLPPR